MSDVDAHVSFRFIPWLEEELDIQVEAVCDLGLRHAKDLEIFEAARKASVVMVTKDRDFVELVEPLQLLGGNPLSEAKLLAGLGQTAVFVVSVGLIVDRCEE